MSVHKKYGGNTSVLTQVVDEMTASRRQRKYSEFRSELKQLLNSRSMENCSNTPDFLLADYLNDCLATWDKCTIARDKWFRFNSHIGSGVC